MKIAVVPGVIPPLVEAINKLKLEFHFVEMEIIQEKTQNVLTSLQMEQVDFALIMHSDNIQNKSIPYNIKKICNGEFHIAMNKNSKLAFYNQIDYETLIKEPLALYQDEHILDYVRHIEKETGEYSNTLFVTNNSNSIIYAVKNNFAITISLQFTFNNEYRNFYNDIKQVPIKVDENRQPFSLWFVSSKRNDLTEITDTFFQLIHHYVNAF